MRTHLDLAALYIGTVAGIKFYEHPTRGDESPLMILKDGKLVRSPFWELPDLAEVENWI